MKILKSVLIIAAVVSMAVPAYAGIKPSNPAFIAEHHSVTPKISVADDANLPVSYDLRDYGRIPRIKDQNPWGTCWSFAALSAVESNYLTSLLSDDARAKIATLANELADSKDINFSPLHLAWFAKNDADRTRAIFTDSDTEEKAWANSTTIIEGGFPNMSLAYFTRLDGPVLETEMPYFSYDFLEKIGYKAEEWHTLRDSNALPSYREFGILAESRLGKPSADKMPAVSDTANIAVKKFNTKLRLTDAFFGSQVYPGINIGVRYDIEKTDPVLRPDPEMTKRLIMQYGAVEMIYNANKPEYLNRETHAYYYDQADNVSANHAVAIIGWDDNFSKENFNSAHRPSKDGAWLVRNNWGRYWPNPDDLNTSNPDGGYFWLSYEQPFSHTLAHIVEDMPENIRVYEHDPLGLCKEAGYENNKTAWAANAFKVKSDGEKLEAISFYTTDSNATVEWKIYTQTERPAVIPYNKDAALILSGSDTFEYPGYHTVKFSEQKPLTKGGYFTVVLKITNSEYFCPVPVELKFKGYANFAVVHDFESWFSEDGENWEDGTWTYLVEGGTVKQTPMNACIKAFTIDGDTSDSDVEADKDLIMFKLVNDFPAVTKANISVPDRPVSERAIIAFKDDKDNLFDEGEKVTFYLVNKDIAEIYVSSKDTSIPNELGLLQLDELEYKSLFEEGYEPDEYWKTSSDKFKIYGIEYPVYGPFVETAELINGAGVFNLNVDELKYGGSSIKDDGLWGAIPDGTYDVVFFESNDVNTFKSSVTLKLAGTTPKTAGMVTKAAFTSEASINNAKKALGLGSSDYLWFVPYEMWGGANSLDDLTDAQKNLIPNTQTAKIALPTITVTASNANYYYVFAISRNTLNNAKLAYADEIFLHLLPDNVSGKVTSSAETSSYKFFDADGNVITRIPASGDVNVAVYLEEGTYIPVISSSSKSEADNGDADDEKTIGVGSSGSGCNIGVNAALIMLAGFSLITFRRRIR